MRFDLRLIKRTGWLTGSILLLGILLVLGSYLYGWSLNPMHRIGDPIDSLNHVPIFHNGSTTHSSGRSTSSDGYNLGQKYQCVEFVKRYYYQRVNHKMPDAYGNAKDFFNPRLIDGSLNPHRGLLQFVNGSRSKPKSDDLLIYDSSFFNRYGHVAIVASVSKREVEIVQQNPGPFSSSRKRLAVRYEGGSWYYEDKRILGWLRKN